ncbi:MAG: prepilin-type N-terminal cleavage/methylation domain-containing protein [bacterium]|nr:prepilin-type N-terminal cleavage/methylation domain-containing protein [bacterium]
MHKKGFALIELLAVIVIVVVLLLIVFISLNPARKLAQKNDEQRRNDVNAILNAVNLYMVDTKGIVPDGITETVQTVSKKGADICKQLVPTYIAALPTDPKAGVGNGNASGAAVTDCAQLTYDTGYTIMQDANGRITVAAPNIELGKVISVTR